MRSVTPQLIAAIITGSMYFVEEDPQWASPESQQLAQGIIDRTNLASAGVGYKQFLFDRYIDGLSFEEIAAKHGKNREWARQRVAKALRLARGKLNATHMQTLRATIRDEEL